MKKVKLQMHLIHLMHWTPQLSLAYLKNAHTKNAGNIVHSVEYLVVLPSWLCAWLGAVAHCCCSTWRQSTVLHSTSLGKRSKFKIRFPLNAYHFCNHCEVEKSLSPTIVKSGTVYINHWAMCYDLGLPIRIREVN